MNHHRSQPQYAKDCGVYGFDGRKDYASGPDRMGAKEEDIELAFRVCCVVAASCTAVHLVQAGLTIDALAITSACISAYHRQPQETSVGFRLFLEDQKLFVERMLASLSHEAHSVVPSDPVSVFRNMVFEALKKVRMVERSCLALDVRNAFHALHIALTFIDVLVCNRFCIRRAVVFQATLAENWGGGIFYRD
jgi:uncharacterized protein (DUF849 family)